MVFFFNEITKFEENVRLYVKQLMQHSPISVEKYLFEVHMNGRMY